MLLVVAILGVAHATAPEPARAVEVPPVADPVPSPPVAARLLATLTSHDRVALACAGPTGGVGADALARAVGGQVLLRAGGPLVESWTQAATDPTGHPQDGLTWLRLGDDPTVGVHTTGQPTPLALADRWTDHWTESPRVRATRDHTVLLSPHGRTPAPGQAEPTLELGSAPLPAHGCAAWSRLPNARAHLVERLVTTDTTSATLRVFAPSARAADAAVRVDTWTFTPATRRRPQAVMLVHTEPHVVAGAPWLQDSRVPERLSGLSTLIPAGYRPAPGQVRAWFDDVVGAAMAVVVPVVDEDGRPADVSTLLADVRDRFGLPGEVEPEGRGGRLAAEGGVAIGALPGALVLSTDPAILVDMLHDQGTQWVRPPARPHAAAAWWLAADATRPAVGATLTIEDRMWRVDVPGDLPALLRATDWADL